MNRKQNTTMSARMLSRRLRSYGPHSLFDGGVQAGNFFLYTIYCLHTDVSILPVNLHGLNFSGISIAAYISSDS